MSLERMTRRFTRRAVAVGLLAGAAGTIGARPFTPGMTFKMRMTMGMPAMPGMNSQGDMVIVGHGSAVGSRNRLDIDSATSGPMAGLFGPGDYFLTLDSGRVVAVNPASKTYIDGFNMAMGSMPPDMMASAVVTNVSANVEKLGAGETIEGRPTDKYRLTIQYVMQIMGQSLTIATESEVSTAQLPASVRTPFSGGLPKAMATGPFAELYAKVAEAQTKISGTAVRSTVSTSITGPMSMTMSQTMQLTDVSPAEVDEALFQVPSGYTAKPPSP